MYVCVCISLHLSTHTHKTQAASEMESLIQELLAGTCGGFVRHQFAFF